MRGVAPNEVERPRPFFALSAVLGEERRREEEEEETPRGPLLRRRPTTISGGSPEVGRIPPFGPAEGIEHDRN